MIKLALLFLLALCSVAQAQRMQPPIQPVGIGCAYNSSPPTLTSGWFGYVQCDSTGKLITSGGGGGLSVTDQAAWTQGTSAFTPSGGVFNDAATLSSGQQGTVRLTTKRGMIVDVDTAGNALYSALTSSVPAGTNLIGDVNLRQGGAALSATNGIYANPLQGNAVLSATNPSFASPIPSTLGGCTSNPVVTSAASTNAANVKASAGTVCDWSATNTHTSIQYVHFYNTAGTPTCNASIISTYAIPPASAAGQVGGFNRTMTFGRAHATGIGICITANADGTGNATSGAVLLNIGYK